MRAEARVLILGRTSWHYDRVRRAAAARPPQARRSARVSEKVAGRAMPDFSKARPLRRVPRSRAAEPRPSSRVPSAPSLSVSRLGDTHSTRTVLLTRTCRAPATVALSSKSRRAFFAASCTAARAMGRRPASCRSRRSATSCVASPSVHTLLRGASATLPPGSQRPGRGDIYSCGWRVTLAAVTSTGGELRK